MIVVNLAAESFYVMLGVKEDKTREVIGIYNRPNESAQGWAEMLTAIKERGVETIGLIVADGLSGLDTAISEVYPETPLQRCTTHLKRNVMNKVGDKSEMTENRLGLLWPIMKEMSRNGTYIDKKCGPEDVRTQKNIIFVKILKVAGLIPGLQTH